MSSKRRRDLKDHVRNLLKFFDIDQALCELSQIPPRKVINPLLSLFYSQDEEIRWKAITAIGSLVSLIAAKDMESARIVMRRLMWNLNDESGGIGWGAPEAMGEIMARHEGLAQEYAHILVSYAREDGNFLEHEPLQCGVLWGLGRLAQARPHILQGRGVIPLLHPNLGSPNATIRALAAWTIGLLGVKDSRSRIEELLGDNASVHLFIDQKISTYRVKEIARDALTKSIDRRVVEVYSEESIPETN